MARQPRHPTLVFPSGQRIAKVNMMPHPFLALSWPNPSFPTQAKKPAISKEGPQKSSLQGRCGGLSDLASRGDPWLRLGGQVKVELLHQQFLIGIEFRVAAED